MRSALLKNVTVLKVAVLKFAQVISIEKTAKWQFSSQLIFYVYWFPWLTYTYANNTRQRREHSTSLIAVRGSKTSMLMLPFSLCSQNSTNGHLSTMQASILHLNREPIDTL